MRTIILCLYHAGAAWHYNRKAARLARQMRSGSTTEIRSDASQRLLSEGATSNMHERERDRHLLRIKARPWRYGPQAVLLVLVVVAVGVVAFR